MKEGVYVIIWVRTLLCNYWNADMQRLTINKFYEMLIYITIII
ncbi:hypothetical protein [Eubacterium sp.]